MVHSSEWNEKNKYLKNLNGFNELSGKFMARILFNFTFAEND